MMNPSFTVEFSRISYFGPYLEANEKLIHGEFVFAIIYRKFWGFNNRTHIIFHLKNYICAIF